MTFNMPNNVSVCCAHDGDSLHKRRLRRAGKWSSTLSQAGVKPAVLAITGSLVQQAKPLTRGPPHHHQYHHHHYHLSSSSSPQPSTLHVCCCQSRIWNPFIIAIHHQQLILSILKILQFLLHTQPAQTFDIPIYFILQTEEKKKEKRRRKKWRGGAEEREKECVCMGMEDRECVCGGGG